MGIRVGQAGNREQVCETLTSLLLLLLLSPLYEWDSALQRTNIGDSHYHSKLALGVKLLYNHIRKQTNKQTYKQKNINLKIELHTHTHNNSHTITTESFRRRRADSWIILELSNFSYLFFLPVCTVGWMSNL